MRNLTLEVINKFDFTIRDKEIWELAQIYQQFNQKRGNFRKFLPSNKDPRESKYWQYFEQAYSIFENESTFDPYMFIEAQYRNIPKEKIIYPAQLKTKAAVDRYKEHRESKKMVDATSKTKNIMTNLANTYNFLKKWWKRNGYDIGDYDSFFRPKENEFISEGFAYCIQNMISKYFMSTSIHFNKYYEKLDSDVKCEVIEPSELKKYRTKLKLDEEAFEFAKEIFGGEVR
jgi:hypothetical protein